MNELTVTNNLAIELTDKALQALTEQRNQLKKFIGSQLFKDVDFGIIPGTKKDCLYKPGAEKLANIFQLGSRIIKNEKEIERNNNYACISITVEVYHIPTNRAISTCEGICNSHETKYKEKNVYEWINGQKVSKGVIVTPIGDLLNTLSKMALKRAFVGAVILATGASDFFTQDLEDLPDMDGDETVSKTKKPSHSVAKPPADPSVLGEYVVKFGKKLSGMKLSEIPKEQLESYIYDYLEKNAKEKNQPLMGDALELYTFGKLFLEKGAPHPPENTAIPN